MRWNATSGEVATTVSCVASPPSSNRSAMRSPSRSIARTLTLNLSSTPGRYTRFSRSRASSAACSAVRA